jgi:hypothetical protein
MAKKFGGANARIKGRPVPGGPGGFRAKPFAGKSSREGAAGPKGRKSKRGR